jgi:hypothetical protein
MMPVVGLKVSDLNHLRRIEIEVLRAARSHIASWIAYDTGVVGHIIEAIMRMAVYPQAHLAKQMIKITNEACRQRRIEKTVGNTLA